MSSIRNEAIMKRDIKEFKGNVLLLGGMQTDFDIYKHVFKIERPSDIIYQVNIKDDPTVDYVVDYTLPAAFEKLGDRKFDVVHFCGVDSFDDILQAIKNAANLLSDSGVLIYMGGSAIGQGTKHAIPSLFNELNLNNIHLKSVVTGQCICGTKNSELTYIEALKTIPNLQFSLIRLGITILLDNNTTRIYAGNFINKPEALFAELKKRQFAEYNSQYVFPPMVVTEFRIMLGGMRDSDFDNDHFIQLAFEWANDFLSGRPQLEPINLILLFKYIGEALNISPESVKREMQLNFRVKQTPITSFFNDLLLRNSENKSTPHHQLFSAEVKSSDTKTTNSASSGKPDLGPKMK